MKNSNKNHLSLAVRDTTRLFLLGSVAYVLSYITRIILARYLSLEDFGLFFSMLSLILFLTIFRNLGLQTAAVKYISDGLAKKDFSQVKTTFVSVLVFQFIFSSLLVAIFSLLAIPMAKYYFKTEQSLVFFRLFLLYLLASPLYIAAKATLQGLQDIKGFALADLSKNLFTLIFTLIFLYLGLSIMAPIYAYSIGTLASFLLLLVPLFKHRSILKYKVTNFVLVTKKMFSFGVPVLFVGFGEVIIGYLDILLLTYLTTLPEVGIYNAALSTALVFLFFGRAITGVLFPTVAKLWGANEKKKMLVGINLIHKYLFVVILPLALTVFFYASQILRLFFGDAFVAGALPFKIVLVGTVFYTVAQINNNILSAIGKPTIAAKILGIIAASNVLFNIILIPMLRTTGAAIATTLSFGLGLILSSFVLHRILGAEIPVSNWIKTFFSGGIFLATALVSSMYLSNAFTKIIIPILIATSVYVGILFLTKVIVYKELKALTRQVLQK